MSEPISRNTSIVDETLASVAAWMVERDAQGAEERSAVDQFFRDAEDRIDQWRGEWDETARRQGFGYSRDSVNLGLLEGAVGGAITLASSVEHMADSALRLFDPLDALAHPVEHARRQERAWELADGLLSLASPAEWILNTEHNQRLAGAVWQGVLQPYQHDLERGDRAKLAGRAVFDVGLAFVGALQGVRAFRSMQAVEAAAAAEAVETGTAVASSLEPALSRVRISVRELNVAPPSSNSGALNSTALRPNPLRSIPGGRAFSTPNAPSRLVASAHGPGAFDGGAARALAMGDTQLTPVVLREVPPPPLSAAHDVPPSSYPTPYATEPQPGSTAHVTWQDRPVPFYLPPDHRDPKKTHRILTTPPLQQTSADKPESAQPIRLQADGGSNGSTDVSLSESDGKKEGIAPYKSVWNQLKGYVNVLRNPGLDVVLLMQARHQANRRASGSADTPIANTLEVALEINHLHLLLNSADAPGKQTALKALIADGIDQLRAIMKAYRPHGKQNAIEARADALRESVKSQLWAIDLPNVAFNPYNASDMKAATARIDAQRAHFAQKLRSSTEVGSRSMVDYYLGRLKDVDRVLGRMKQLAAANAAHLKVAKSYLEVARAVVHNVYAAAKDLKLGIAHPARERVHFALPEGLDDAPAVPFADASFHAPTPTTDGLMGEVDKYFAKMQRRQDLTVEVDKHVLNKLQCGQVPANDVAGASSPVVQQSPTDLRPAEVAHLSAADLGMQTIDVLQRSSRPGLGKLTSHVDAFNAQAYRLRTAYESALGTADADAAIRQYEQELHAALKDFQRGAEPLVEPLRRGLGPYEFEALFELLSRP